MKNSEWLSKSLERQIHDTEVILNQLCINLIHQRLTIIYVD